MMTNEEVLKYLVYTLLAAGQGVVVYFLKNTLNEIREIAKSVTDHTTRLTLLEKGAGQHDALIAELEKNIHRLRNRVTKIMLAVVKSGVEINFDEDA